MRISWLIAAQAAALSLALAAPAAAQHLGRQLATGARLATLGHDLTRPVETGAPTGTAEPAASPATTDDGSVEDGWDFDLAAQTSLPLSVGLEAHVQTPVGVTGYLSVGHTPHGYMDAVASALGDAGVFKERMRPAIDDTIAEGGWNLRLGVGYTAFDGLELSFGYTMITTSSSLRPAAVETALNRVIPWPDGMDTIPLTVTLHALHGRVGWRFAIEDHFIVRVAIGWTHTVAAEAHLDVPEDLRAPEGDDPATNLEDGIRNGMGELGFSPELILSAGYRF